MKISKEIKSLKKRIKKIFDEEEPIEYLMMGIEYDHETGKWKVTPVYESTGDDHPSYMCDKKVPFEGTGKTLVGAIVDLKKKVRRLEKKGWNLFQF
jgi:hypothetical protein